MRRDSERALRILLTTTHRRPRRTWAKRAGGKFKRYSGDLIAAPLVPKNNVSVNMHRLQQDFKKQKQTAPGWRCSDSTWCHKLQKGWAVDNDLGLNTIQVVIDMGIHDFPRKWLQITVCAILCLQELLGAHTKLLCSGKKVVQQCGKESDLISCQPTLYSNTSRQAFQHFPIASELYESLSQRSTIV